MSKFHRSWYLSCRLTGDRLNLKTRSVDVDRGVVRRKLNIRREDDGSVTVRVFDPADDNHALLVEVVIPVGTGDAFLEALLGTEMPTAA